MILWELLLRLFHERESKNWLFYKKACYYRLFMIFWSLGNNDSRSFFLIKFELDVQIQEVNPKMANKAELISEVAANTKLTKKQAAVAIDAI